jgi:hypothetical protein
MFLQMSDKDGGGIHQSPSFTFAQMDAATPARPAMDQNVGQATAVQTNPYQWNDGPTAAISGAEITDAYPTPTDGKPIHWYMETWLINRSLPY